MEQCSRTDSLSAYCNIFPSTLSPGSGHFSDKLSLPFPDKKEEARRCLFGLWHSPSHSQSLHPCVPPASSIYNRRLQAGSHQAYGKSLSAHDSSVSLQEAANLPPMTYPYGSGPAHSSKRTASTPLLKTRHPFLWN